MPSELQNLNRGVTASSPPCQEKMTESSNSWVRLGKVGTESDEFGTQDLEANTEFRHSVFSRAVSAVQPFEVREGLEGEYTPEIPP